MLIHCGTMALNDHLWDKGLQEQIDLFGWKHEWLLLLRVILQSDGGLELFELQINEQALLQLTAVTGIKMTNTSHATCDMTAIVPRSWIMEKAHQPNLVAISKSKTLWSVDTCSCNNMFLSDWSNGIASMNKLNFSLKFFRLWLELAHCVFSWYYLDFLILILFCGLTYELHIQIPHDCTVKDPTCFMR